MKQSKYLFLLSSLILLLTSCGEEEKRNTIPFEQVRFKIDLNNQDNLLKDPLTSKIFLKARLANEYVGYSGLLVVCGITATTSGKFNLYAYDLCCPHEAMRETRVTPLKDGTAICNICQTVYDIASGTGYVKSGISKSSLQRYMVNSVSGSPGVFSITR